MSTIEPMASVVFRASLRCHYFYTVSDTGQPIRGWSAAYPERILAERWPGNSSITMVVWSRMQGSGPNEVRPGGRVAAILLSPFVLLWDLGRYLMFGFFGLLERLDPFAFAWRLLRRLAPPVVRLWRAILPSLLRIQTIVAAVNQRLSALVAPLLCLVRPLVDRVWRMLAVIGRSVAAVITRSAAEIRRRSATTVRRLRTAWNLAARPFRAVAAATRRQVGQIREDLARIRRFQ